MANVRKFPTASLPVTSMLGEFGSSDAESALWRRYASWNAQWLGRESQLITAFTERNKEKGYQLSLGQNLMQALATGKSWFADKASLQRLSQLTKIQRIQQQLDVYLTFWEDQQVTIFLDHSLGDFHARVAQYEFQSMDALKDKLSQFPSGTKFVVPPSPVESTTYEQTLTDLRTFLSSHGMSVSTTDLMTQAPARTYFSSSTERSYSFSGVRRAEWIR